MLTGCVLALFLLHISYFMIVSLHLPSKTVFLGEGNSLFISMDALFLHIRSAVLPCQSSSYNQFKTSGTDELVCDWLPYVGRDLLEGRVAVFQQQSSGCLCFII